MRRRRAATCRGVRALPSLAEREPRHGLASIRKAELEFDAQSFMNTDFVWQTVSGPEVRRADLRLDATLAMSFDTVTQII